MLIIVKTVFSMQLCCIVCYDCHSMHLFIHKIMLHIIMACRYNIIIVLHNYYNIMLWFVIKWLCVGVRNTHHLISLKLLLMHWPNT